MDVTNPINLREIDNILYKYGRAIIYGPNWNMDQVIAYLKKCGYIARRGADPSYIEVVLEEPSALLEDIRKRHERDERWRNGPSTICSQSHDDQATLLAEVDRLRAEIEALHAALKRRDTERPIEIMSPAEKMAILDRLRVQERQRRATLEGKL